MKNALISYFYKATTAFPIKGYRTHSTYSAWVYEELKIANGLIADSALQESRIKAMRVSHNITNLLRRFKSISLDGLCKKISFNFITKDLE
ncbi:putative uncharacterized protein [Helicobacter pylori]|nr:putative uncharacterized protein [Helicobacter pylori]GHR39880.1 hypothetical protein JP0097_08430 [Helicobacter pylori]